VEFGHSVEIGGLKIEAGDLIHGDRHGVQSIPLESVAGIPQEAEKIRCAEEQLIEYCRSPQFSLEGLSEKLRKGLKDYP
jgi:regulator of RNase E activity RraA